jgi:hypothetical protein
MLWALLPPMAVAPKRSPSKRGESWLVPFRWWTDWNKCREALAAVNDDELCTLSDLGRQVRGDARRECSARAGMLPRLFADVIESRRRCAEREVARYLARFDEYSR